MAKVAEYKQISTEIVEEQIIVNDYNDYGEIIGRHTETIRKEVPVMGMVYRDMTAEEEEQARKEAEEMAEYERTRPRTTEEKVDDLTATTDDIILMMAEIIGG